MLSSLLSASRRQLLLAGGLASLVSGWLPAAPSQAASSQVRRPRRKDHIYAQLGVRTRINAKGTYTYLTGSLLPPEVSEAMAEAAEHYVVLEELQDAVGSEISKMLGVESAMVTSGAAGAIVLGTAACITGKDAEKILRLPDTEGMKNEVILQKSHRNPFDHAIRNCGVRLVVVETREELDRAINERTAMMFFLNLAQNQGRIGLEEWVEVGKRRGVPTFNDAAADVPPPSHLSDYNRMGFDLVAFSGGKGLRGPQCAGLLLGRRDLIEAARLNNNPHEDAIGRPMKVGKEEIVGMYVALKRYLALDHSAEWKMWERRLEVIERAARSVPGVQTSRFVPEIANHVPHLNVSWDEAALGMTKQECARQLEEGEPSIVCLAGEDRPGVSISPWMLMPGEESVVARRLREVLSGARPNAA
jgi:L-seryl-tRNA(Ser) seleniumtransferase